MRTRLLMFVVCLCVALPLSGQPSQGQHISTKVLIEQLRSVDPLVRGNAKLTLMAARDPETVPLLAEALVSSSGDLRSALLEILSTYKDARKIFALVTIARPYDWPNNRRLEEQLIELGAPAAEALMASIPGDCFADPGNPDPVGFTSWAARVIGEMGTSGKRVLLDGLRSGSKCKQHAAQEGLHYMYSGEEPGRGLYSPKVHLLVEAIQNDNPTIRRATAAWLDSLPRGDLKEFDPEQVVDVLIHIYQSGVPAATMAEIARLLDTYPSERITRFMRAAAHAPNPAIRKTAHEYLASNAPIHPTDEKPTLAPMPLRNSREKLYAIEQWTDIADTRKLAKLLTDSDPTVRAAAAQGLGSANAAPTRGDDERERDLEGSLRPLVKALADSSADVRVAAVQAIGQIRYFQDDGPGILKKLMGLLQDPDSSVVTNTIDVLSSIVDADPITVATGVVAIIDHKDSAVRVAAIDALANMDAAAATCPLLSRLKSDPDAKVRVHAAHSLMNQFKHKERCPGDVDLLLTALQDPTLSSWVALPLGRIKDGRAVQPLIAALGPSTTCAVASALGELGDNNAVKPLLPFLPDPCVLGALGRLSDARAVPFISPLLKNPDPDIRAQATRVLIDMNQCQLMAELRKGLSDDAAQVRELSAEAAGKCKDIAALEVLQRNLPFDLKSAAIALGNIGDRRAVGSLIAVLKQKQLYGRAFVAHALGQLRDPEAVEILVIALQDDSPTSDSLDVRGEAAWALSEIGDPRAIAPLQRAVREAPPTGSYVSAAAIVALKRFGASIPISEGK